MMLVDPGWRGRGLGARLLKAAMDALPAGRPIRLDATPLGRPLYQRHGFGDEAMLTRHVTLASSTCPEPDAATAEPPLRRLATSALPLVASSDALLFGADRRVLLEWLLAGAPHYSHVIESEGAPQYCFGRHGRLFDQIGPVVAADDETACALVRASLAAARGRAVVVDAFDTHGRFAGWLRRCGFVGERPLFRMCRAGTRTGAAHAPHSNGSLDEIGILGPEFG
jgi:hypothetical protein